MISRLALYLATLAALLALCAGCGLKLPAAPKGPDLAKSPEATPVAMQQTSADLAQTRQQLAASVAALRQGFAQSWAWLAKLPEGPAREQLSQLTRSAEQQVAKQEMLLPDLDKAETQLAAQTQGATKLARENASLKAESFRWLNWTVLPAGILALVAAAALAAYGLGLIARGLAVGGAVAVLLALFLPSLAALATLVVWGVAALMLAGVLYLLWSHRKALAEVVPAVETLKSELPAELKQRWFTGTLPGMSTFQSDSTQALVQALRPQPEQPSTTPEGQR